MERCRVVLGRTARTSACALELTGVIDDRCSMRSSLRALQIHYNGNDGSAYVNLCSLNVWNGCHVGPGRTARTLHCCVLEFEGVIAFEYAA